MSYKSLYLSWLFSSGLKSCWEETAFKEILSFLSLPLAGNLIFKKDLESQIIASYSFHIHNGGLDLLLNLKH